MPNAALSQKLTPSPKLADILGSSQPLSRADAVKELWDYFKKHNLQDPKNRREIRADANLRPLFGKDHVRSRKNRKLQFGRRKQLEETTKESSLTARCGVHIGCVYSPLGFILLR